MEAVPKIRHAKIGIAHQMRTYNDLWSGLLGPQLSSVSTLVS